MAFRQVIIRRVGPLFWLLGAILESILNQTIEPYCAKRFSSISRHFSFLHEQHEYQFRYLKRQGRFNSECVFGMEATGKPKFQFGGETGDYVAIAAPSASYSLESEGGVCGPWLYIEGIHSYLSGGVPMPWLVESIDSGNNRFERWKELSEITLRLLPWLIKTFSDPAIADSWRIEYDSACALQTSQWLNSNDYRSRT